MEALQTVLTRFRESWRSMSFNQRAVLGIVMGAGLLSLVLFSVWLSSDSMVVLYSGLSPEDAAQAMDHLTRQGVKVEVRSGGGTILVPSEQVDRLRMEMVLEGIGGDGLRGWDLFDEKIMGETEFGMNVRLKRAIEGELARSIASIEAIKASRVHITMPKQSVFLRDRRPATASVLLELRSRRAPTEDQIEGVQYLVAAAVDGMEADKVTVIDGATGRVLSSDSGTTTAGISNAQLRVRQEVENHLVGKATDMLQDVLGLGRFVVRVNADLDFEQLERTSENFDQQTVVRSEQTDESTEAGGNGSTYAITNYEVPKTVETVLRHGSILKKMTVAVAVDGVHGSDDAGAATYTARSSEDLAQIQRMVSGAVGLDPARGDTIEVVNMQFDGPQDFGGSSWMELPILQDAPELIGKFLLFLVAAGLVLSLRKSFTGLLGEASAPPAARDADARPTGTPSLGGESSPDRPGGSLPPLPSVEAEVATIEDWARGKPEEVADLIKSFALQDQA